MKTIIAGTDFTPSSLNACRYAAFLAEKLNCKLTIFNMFETPVVHYNVGLYGISYTALRKTSQARTLKVVEQLKKLFPGLEITMFVSNGGLKRELKDFIAAHKVQAAVMGLEAKSRISKFIYGSEGVNIAGKIEAPVFIVPQQFRQHKLSKVLLAVDNTEKLYKTSLKGFEKFLRVSGAGVQLLHVRTEDELLEPVISSVKLNGKKMPINVIQAADVQEGVKKFCKTETIDLVTIVSKKHSAFYNFFVESNTKKVAFTTKVPVLAIHE